ncbi:hypothetical protein BT93_J0505 [Corymbia citriodora subsp. variegata]|nr:hypothetical protein BT93_J0505 [Corymbia citriodora subsp. variegata]
MSSTFQFVDPSDRQARPPPLSSDNSDGRRGCSKAQACLHRILRIIASAKDPSSSLQSSSRGLGIDLNLRLCGASFGDEEEEGEEENVGFGDESGSFSSSSVVAPQVDERTTVLEKSSEVDCEAAKQTDEPNCEPVVVGGDGDLDKAGEEVEVEEEEEEEEENGDDGSGSEITNVQVQSFEKSDEDRASEMKPSNRDGFLGLLVEAAKLVSGDDAGEGDEDEDGETETRERPGQRHELHDSPRTKANATEASTKTELQGSKRKRQISEAAFVEPEADAAPPQPPPPPPQTQPSSLPVVRSKRGRNQVLPYRFRDSVLEPWARLSRSNPVPTKRRVGVKP